MSGIVSYEEKKHPENWFSDAICNKSTMWFIASWNWFVEGQLKMQARGRQNILSRCHFRGSTEAKTVEKNVDSRACAIVVQEGNKGFIGGWAWKSCLYHSGKEYNCISLMEETAT